MRSLANGHSDMSWSKSGLEAVRFKANIVVHQRLPVLFIARAGTRYLKNGMLARARVRLYPLF